MTLVTSAPSSLVVAGVVLEALVALLQHAHCPPEAERGRGRRGRRHRRSRRRRGRCRDCRVGVRWTLSCWWMSHLEDLLGKPQKLSCEESPRLREFARQPIQSTLVKFELKLPTK